MENNRERDYNCGHGLCNSCQTCMQGGKNHFWRKLFWIVILLITFCMGSAWGQMKAEIRSFHRYNKMFEPSYMMRGGNLDFEYRIKNLDDAPKEESPEAPLPPTN